MKKRILFVATIIAIFGFAGCQGSDNVDVPVVTGAPLVTEAVVQAEESYENLEVTEKAEPSTATTSSPGPTATSDPTPTPTPTATPVPTATPEPTATPVPTPDVKQVMQEAFEAYGAFEKQLREDGIYYTAQYSFIYLDEDAIPECLLWADVMEGSTPAAVYVLSYRDGKVLSYRGETAYLSIDSFDYTPRSGKFKIYSALGQGNSEMWLIGELTDDIRQIGEAAGWGYWDWEGTEEYIMCQSVNGKQVTPKEQGDYLNAHYCTDAVDESQRYGTMEKAYQKISK